MIRGRRQQDRPVNGAAEWFLVKAEGKAQKSLKEAIIKTLEQIEDLEQNLNLGSEINKENGSYLLHDIRNKRFIESQYKLKLNRLSEEYRHLTKIWK